MLKLKSLFVSLTVSLFAFSQAEIVPLSLGSQLPSKDVELKSTQGKTTTLGMSMAENGLIVIFTSNTCPFVVGGEDYPGWEKDYNTLFEVAKKAGVSLVLVNSNEAKRDKGESMDDMITRAKEKEYLMPYLYDYENKLANSFNAKTTPHVYYFNGGGLLIYEGSIDNTWDVKRKKDEAYLVDAIESTAKGKEIKNANTPAKGCSIKRK